MALPRERFIFWIAILLYVLLQLLIEIDIRVYALYRFHLNSMVWNLITGGAVAEILVFDWINFLIAGAVILIIFTGEYFLGKWLLKRVQKTKGSGGRRAALLVFTIMLAGQFIYAWGDLYQNVSVTRQIEMLPWPQPLTVKRNLRKLGLLPEAPDDEPKVKIHSNGRLAYPKQAMQCSQENSQLNVLLIAVDGLRYDMLTPEIMPNTWRLTQHAWRFTNHYSTGNATRFGIFGLFYGLHGGYWHALLREQKGAVLIKQFRDQNYRFGLFGSARLSSPEFDRTVFADIQDQVPDETEGTTVVARDLRITQLMLDFINTDSSQAFFGFLFYDAPHAYAYPDNFAAPFQPAWEDVNYVSLDNETDPTGFLNRYKNAVHFNDAEIGKVLDALAKSPHANDTVIVITGDHGQEFNESKGNYWGHNGNFSRYQTKVPLLIAWPGEQAKKLSHLSSHTDLAPTLAKDLLGCTNDSADFSNGKHLLDTSAREYVVAASWNRFAIVESDQITVFKELGLNQVYTKDYQPLPDAKPRPEISVKVMQDMSQFLAR